MGDSRSRIEPETEEEKKKREEAKKRQEEQQRIEAINRARYLQALDLAMGKKNIITFEKVKDKSVDDASAPSMLLTSAARKPIKDLLEAGDYQVKINGKLYANGTTTLTLTDNKDGTWSVQPKRAKGRYGITELLIGKTPFADSRNKPSIDKDFAMGIELLKRQGATTIVLDFPEARKNGKLRPGLVDYDKLFEIAKTANAMNCAVEFPDDILKSFPEANKQFFGLTLSTKSQETLKNLGKRSQEKWEEIQPYMQATNSYKLDQLTTEMKNLSGTGTADDKLTKLQEAHQVIAASIREIKTLSDGSGEEDHASLQALYNTQMRGMASAYRAAKNLIDELKSASHARGDDMEKAFEKIKKDTDTLRDEVKGKIEASSSPRPGRRP